jgi:hypothetical protein
MLYFEVDHHLVPFGHSDAHIQGALGAGMRPPAVSITVSGSPEFERQPVAAGNRRVEDAKAVLTPLHLHRRPRPPLTKMTSPKRPQ